MDGGSSVVDANNTSRAPAFNLYRQAMYTTALMDSSSPPLAYKVSPLRWLILVLFSLNNASNAFLWISFSPIVVTTATAFQVSQAAINWLSLVFLVLFFPGTLLTSFSIDRYGTRWTLITASLLNCLGAWLRYIGLVSNLPHSGGFAIALVGQSLASLHHWHTLGGVCHWDGGGGSRPVWCRVCC